jgi:hypothetical protein
MRAREGGAGAQVLAASYKGGPTFRSVPMERDLMALREEPGQWPLPQHQRTLWCQVCCERTAEHLMWFKVTVDEDTKLTVGQSVCDVCLDTAVRSVEAARMRRIAMKQTVSMVRVARL